MTGDVGRCSVGRGAGALRRGGRNMDNAQVRYSIYSNIDVAWRMDPSCRRIFSVINGPPSR